MVHGSVAGTGLGARARDGHGHVVERHGDRRVRFVHGHVDRADRVDGEQRVGDVLREFFDEVDVRAFDDGDDRLGGAAVVDGVDERVGAARGREVEMERRVHDERLCAFVFEVEHAVRAVGAYAGQCDRVHVRPLSVRSPVSGPDLAGTSS